MSRTSGRTSEDTRRLLLDAATRVIRDQGVGATLEEIARAAGVSKGGLVYHYASKEALLVALTQEQLEDFRTAVESQLAEPEGTPGRLTRAYVRTCMIPIDGEEQRERFALITQLITLPTVLELVRADDDRWHRDLEADAVPRATRNLVIAAADGVGGPPLWASRMTAGERDQLTADLLAMVDAAVTASVD
jgi:AcrR family transcriptional regulator